jgi:peptidoglycan lytic transglycosylase B
MRLRYLAFVLLIPVCSPAVRALDVDRPEIRTFIDQMAEKSDYDRKTLNAVLRDAKSQQSILDAISRPAEKTKEWHEYRAIFITDERIEAGATFWREHEPTLSRISKETGVSKEILVGIIGVETYFGRITGNYRVIDALATLAFDYPPRSKFFTRELEEFLLLVREEDMNAADATGSYAGAMGRPQFMPSSYRAYAVDSSEDGKRDIWGDWEDVIGSVANYFVRHHWRRDQQIVVQAVLGDQWHGAVPKNSLKAKDTVSSLSGKGVMFSTSLPAKSEAQLLTLQGKDGAKHWVGFHNFFVITRYNTSVMYALAVQQLGQEIALEIGRDPS